MAASGGCLKRLVKEKGKTGRFEFKGGHDLELIADDLPAVIEYAREVMDLLASLNGIEREFWRKRLRKETQLRGYCQVKSSSGQLSQSLFVFPMPFFSSISFPTAFP
jgi:hypothetical protein